MDLAIDLLLRAILIGAGATAILDFWAAGRKWLFGAPSADYGLVGRWLASMPRGRFFHDPITASPAVKGERLIGWIAHYLIGIAFAVLLLLIYGIAWARHPTMAPALVIGIGGVAAPFLLMQPGMGYGIAASRTPSPTAARLRSLLSHLVFGFGLYVAGWTMSLLKL